MFKAATDVDTEIVDVANEGHFDLLLMGVARSIYEGSLLGRILGFTAKIINPERLLDQVTGKENIFDEAPFDEHTRLVLSRTNIPTGVFIDKGLQQINTVFVPALTEGDAWLLPYLERMASNTGAQITIAGNTAEFKKLSPGLTANKSNPVKLIPETTIDNTLLQQQHLMLISEDSWRKLVELKLPWLAEIPSALILVRK